MLLNRISHTPGYCSSLTFIGVAKHAGKTTVLQACIAEAEKLGVHVGVVSIGVDGEKFDAISGVPKPEIYVPAGTRFASATKALDAGTAQFRLLADTGISSPLGNVFLCQVEHAGTVLLAGVRQVEHVRRIQQLMRAGTENTPLDYILIDGAFDRTSQAHIDICDYVVIATGAVVAQSLQAIVEKTYQVLWKFQIPVIQDNFIKRVMQAQSFVKHGNAIAVTQEKNMHTLHTSIFEPTFRLPENTEAVCLAGALTDRFVEQVLATKKQRISICVLDPTKVFATYKAWRLAERNGHRLYVYARPKVLALTINPYDIRGRTVPDRELKAAIQTIAGDIPVLNVNRESEGQ